MTTITIKTLIKRINRALARTTDHGNWIGQRLRTARGMNETNIVGRYHLVDGSRNIVTASSINPVELARELGCLDGDEVIDEERYKNDQTVTTEVTDYPNNKNKEIL